MASLTIFVFILSLCRIICGLQTMPQVARDREGFWNKTSSILIQPPLNLHNHIGLNFRTCLGGHLFQQNSMFRNKISLDVTSDGVIFSIFYANRLYETTIKGNFLDNSWHTVNIITRLGNITISVADQKQTIANSSYNTELLNSDVTILDKTSSLVVGEGFVGCILEGPSIVLSSPANQAYNVEWGTCPLTSDSCTQLDHCSNEPCMMHGSCVSGADRYQCHCGMRYSGNNCEIDNGSPCQLNSNPCQNKGVCREDKIGNYECICEAGFTGVHCESEISSNVCDDNPCKNDGICKKLPGGNRYECICAPGFAGKECETNINECLSIPCLNSGTCIDGVNSYTCMCRGTGYTGANCEININECENSPCLHGGKCFDYYGGYTCQCEPSYAGQNCEISIDECSWSPCKNGGYCESHGGAYECRCRAGFSGRNCQLDINECEGAAVCPPYTVCVNDVGSYHCACAPKYTGVPPNCTEISACSSEPCMNGGVCLPSTTSDSSFNCKCPTGFTGKVCQMKTDECALNPCQNGGTCLSDGNGFKCNCTNDFTGSLCQVPNDACAFKPCENNGTCNIRNSRNDYYCNCTKGFVGFRCEINVNDCEPNPCLPHMICLDGVNSYECHCPEGYRGEACSEPIVAERCRPNICQNGGICIDSSTGLDGGYQCFCTPGYTGDHCELEIDECLSHPCVNGATCINLVNRYNCTCAPGFTGRDCGIEINECESNPCMGGSTCIDGNATYTCQCPEGLTGSNCNINVDDCEPIPCKNGGQCLDGINSYTCNCSDTGFTGTHCEIQIDDCYSNPCVNNATCVDQIKDYNCHCFPGYTGKNCQIDINECDSSPCQEGGTCFERSDKSLYNSFDNNIPLIFHHDFHYSNAYGYECLCIPGITGANCEINIDDCEVNECKNGKCVDAIGYYTCECSAGYTGQYCGININECDPSPCMNGGTCDDRIAGYYCDCPPNYGGKNCSVKLMGCDEPACLNNGTCKPYLIDEVHHKFNCSCPSGFYGSRCEKITTMSLNGESHIIVNTTREEGYDVSFSFKTTMSSGLLALGRGSTFCFLELVNGRLNLRSSLLNKWEGVFIGSQLNDSNWQKVFVNINSSHVVLAANEEQTIYPINLNNLNESGTSFPTTFIGGTDSSLRHLTEGPAFIGCTENIIINGQWVIPGETVGVPYEMQGVEVGCQRRDQCHPNPCYNGGQCTDLWKNFSCACPRPFLGNTCQYNLTAATFGHENITNSLVSVAVYNQAKKAIRNMVDISMFIRTRQSKGAIFYLGSIPNSVMFSEETRIAAELEAGELLVHIQFNGTPESYTVGGVKLNDGCNHLIQVVRNVTLIQVKINGTEYFRKTIGTSAPLDAQLLYLGGFPMQSHNNGTTSTDSSSVDFQRGRRDTSVIKMDGLTSESFVARYTRQTVDKLDTAPNFKGVIQDVQISNGTGKMVVEFFPLKVKDLSIPKPFGNVTFDTSAVLEGVLSDDACMSNPCFNNAQCNVTWNDFVCNCTRGYKGKQCQEMEFCQLQYCPQNSECRNLQYGYECVANATLSGAADGALRYSLAHNVPTAIALNSVRITYRSRVGGTLLYVCNDREAMPDHMYFSVFVFNDLVTIAWKLDVASGEQFRKIKKEHPDGEWTTIEIKIMDNKMQVSFLGLVDEPGQYFSTANFSSIAWNNLIEIGKIYIGGGDRFLEDTLLSDKHSYIFDGESSNSVDFIVSDISSNVEPSILQSLGNQTPNGISYKGCIGEVRIGNLLLPYFTAKQLNGSTQNGSDYFVLHEKDVTLGCYLCFSSDCKNGGRCSNPTESYSCKCAVGFDGEDCSNDIDECVGSNCQHGGTCVDDIGNYTCQCTIGWTGWQCDQDIDECLSQPCQNNGTCIDNLGYYKCNCMDEFVGKQCEQKREITCENEPCKNGAHCSDTPNQNTGDNFTCSCSDGFIGTYCDDTFCSVTPCRNKGLCRKNKVPVCECINGFTGKYCEENIDDCRNLPDTSPPCLHKGKCIDGIASFSCNCTNTGYHGERCEIDTDECELGIATCGERGKCKNEEGGYKCECEPNVCGYHCDLYDPCIEMPCQNGGTCHEKCTTEPDYECICPPEFVGKNCTEKPLYSPGKVADIALIVGPIVFILLVAGMVSLAMFFMMARNKRATRGTYSPSSQEYCNPRVELDNVLKPPPEERLI